jgi:DNA polymerase I-like protein with 3'-5' exonuclease and polymerase domains
MFPNIADRVIAIDTETPDLNWHTGTKPFGISVSTDEGDHYWDVRKTPEVLGWLTRELPKVKLAVCHNAKFDIHMLANCGVTAEGKFDCTMTRAALIDEHLMKYDLDYLGSKYVGVGKDTDIYEELAEMFGGRPTKNAQVANFHRAPMYLIGRYAMQDTNTTLKLWKWQQDAILKEGLGTVCEFERRLMVRLVKMEHNGVPVDVDAAERAMGDISVEIKSKQRELDSLAGFEVNFNPSGSITKLFEPQQDDKGNWILNDGTIAEKTEGGKASINADVLRKMKHPAASLILRLRKLTRAKDVFLAKHVLGHQVDGRVYPTINQTKNDDEAGTGTGRLSYTGPALQQMSSRDKEMAAIVRSVFIPEQGHKWLKMDWSQMDFRMFAHYLNDETILQKYRDNPDTDFHRVTSDITGLPRSPRFSGDANSKQINLGMVFGMGKGKLAWEMGLPYTVEVRNGREMFIPGPEAEEVFNKYHSNIPGVAALLSSAANIAKNRGYVRTVMDRHIHFPGGQFVHKAGGLIFQGSAADCMKQKIIEVGDFAEDNCGILLLSVHDELGISVPDDRDLADKFASLFCRFDGELTPFSFRVPIRCEWGLGDNWYQAGL